MKPIQNIKLDWEQLKEKNKSRFKMLDTTDYTPAQKRLPGKNKAAPGELLAGMGKAYGERASVS